MQTSHVNTYATATRFKIYCKLQTELFYRTHTELFIIKFCNCWIGDLFCSDSMKWNQFNPILPITFATGCKS